MKSVLKVDIMTYLGVDEERAEGIKHSLKNREPDTIIDAAMHNYCNNFITQLLPHLIELSASTTHNGSIVTVCEKILKHNYQVMGFLL